LIQLFIEPFAFHPLSGALVGYERANEILEPFRGALLATVPLVAHVHDNTKDSGGRNREEREEEDAQLTVQPLPSNISSLLKRLASSASFCSSLSSSSDSFRCSKELIIYSASA